MASSTTNPQAEDYQASLRALLPPGLLWRRKEGGPLDQLLLGLGHEFAEVADRALDLHEEMDPNTTAELLADWERIAGLPDPCLLVPPSTTTDRRAALVAKLRFLGGQSPGFYRGLAKTLGFTIGLVEFRPFQAGPSSGDPLGNGSASRAGDELTNGDWIHTVRIHAGEESIRDFVAGSKAGEALRSWGNEVLECAFAAAKPGHSIFLHVYDWCLVPEDMLDPGWTITAQARTPVVALSPPAEAHGRAWTIGTTPTATAQGFYAHPCGTFEAVGVAQYVHGFFRLPATGTFAPRFRLSLYDGVTQKASRLCTWVGSNLTANGPGPAPEDLGAGWWRVRCDFESDAGAAGNPRIVAVQIPESATFPDKLVDFAPGYTTVHDAP